jgi:hypothetical protein
VQYCYAAYIADDEPVVAYVYCNNKITTDESWKETSKIFRNINKTWPQPSS